MTESTENNDILDTVLNLIGGEDSGTSEVLAVVRPYLPALKRLGKAAVDTFMDGVKQRDWQRIDRELYASMTEDERDALGAQILADARAVVAKKYETNRNWQEDLTRVLLGLALALL